MTGVCPPSGHLWRSDPGLRGQRRSDARLRGKQGAAVPPDPLLVIYGQPSTGPPLCDTSRSVSVRALLVTPFARDASPSVSVGRTRNPGHRGFTGSPELPPNPERLIGSSEGRNAYCVTAVIGPLARDGCSISE